MIISHAAVAFAGFVLGAFANEWARASVDEDQEGNDP
jgi:hypothetical protein